MNRRENPLSSRATCSTLGVANRAERSHEDGQDQYPTSPAAFGAVPHSGYSGRHHQFPSLHCRLSMCLCLDEDEIFGKAGQPDGLVVHLDDGVQPGGVGVGDDEQPVVSRC